MFCCLHGLPVQCPWRPLLQESLPQPRKVFVPLELSLLKVLPLTIPVGVSLPQPLSVLLTIQVQIRRTSQVEAFKVRKSNVIFLVSPSAGREADPGRRGVALAPDPDPTRHHPPRDGTIASLAAPHLRTSRQDLRHLILCWLE